MNPVITCPNCKHKFSPDEAFSHELEEKLKLSLRDEFNQKYLVEKKKLEEKISDETGKELKLLQEQLSRQKQELDKAHEYELDLRKKTRELEEKEKNLELEKQRQLDEERAKIREEAARQLLEEHRLRDAEKDKKMADMAKMIEELKLKSSITSQQLQGEVLELELEELLAREFPVDQIVPVGKGIKGADVMQIVKDKIGRDAGKIVWESKRTKNFEDGWVLKLKEDMREAKADIAVIVSVVLPKDVRFFSNKDGVYVTSFECVLQVAQILRKNLIELTHTKALQVGKNEKIESLYRYITSTEFAQQIDSMIETYSRMQATLDKDKMNSQKTWAERQQQIDRLRNNTLTMHGSLSGLIDSPMPEVKSLSFTEIEIIE